MDIVLKTRDCKEERKANLRLSETANVVSSLQYKNFKKHEISLSTKQNTRNIIKSVLVSAVVDTTFVDIYVDTKNIPTCRYNVQHIDKRTMENKMSIIM